MKRTIPYVLLLLVGLSACAPTVPQLGPQDILQRLTPMRDLESRFEKLQDSASLAMQLGLSPTDEEAEALRNHVDLYWIHYYAANVAIANHDLKSYERHLDLSQMAIEDMESTVKKIIHAPQSDRYMLEPVPRLEF